MKAELFISVDQVLDCWTNAKDSMSYKANGLIFVIAEEQEDIVINQLQYFMSHNLNILILVQNSSMTNLDSSMQ